VRNVKAGNHVSRKTGNTFCTDSHHGTGIAEDLKNQLR